MINLAPPADHKTNPRMGAQRRRRRTIVVVLAALAGAAILIVQVWTSKGSAHRSQMLAPKEPTATVSVAAPPVLPLDCRPTRAAAFC